MRWKKLGLMFQARGELPWMFSHAALPVPVMLENGLARIFFSVRDASSKSSVAWIDFDLTAQPPRVVRVSPQPVLHPGNPGSFDDSGVSIGCIVRTPGEDRLYYMGWNLGVVAPWRNSIGLALGDASSGKFERFSQGPIMDRSPEDPFTLSYPWVIRSGEHDWHMWYGSNLTWGTDKGADMSHIVKHAVSSDGIRWERDGAAVIDYVHDDEYAIARPCVLRDGNIFKAWYAYRGDRYRIGYAESADGLQWTRRDDLVGINTSPDGWDSEMICYPCVFDAHGRRWMLYNGNGYGRTGFGLAVLEQE